MGQTCEQCGQGNNLSRRGARFCSTRCRVAWHRAAKRLPARMTSERRWVRAVGKVPKTVTGAPASSTDPATWASFDAVNRSTVGDGFGVMLGDGLGCYDLDKVSDDEARELAAEIPEPILFVERSISGRGVHVFVRADESPGSRKWQGHHERYTRERFIRMTGDRLTL